MPELPQDAGMEAQFRRLIEELVSGNMNRARFRPWEIEILLDIEGCRLTGRSRLQILSEYEQAALQDLNAGAQKPFTLSTYLESRHARSKTAARKPPGGEQAPKPKVDRRPGNR